MTRAGDGVSMVGDVEEAGWSADEAVTRLFSAHYRQLVRLAVLLLADRAVAEELVQDAYVQLHARWGRLREPHKALGYLRASVVNAARSAQRRRGVAERPARSSARWARWRTPRWSPRCGRCRPASAKPWYCATTWTSPRAR